MTHQPESHPRRGTRMKRLSIPRIVKDIRVLADSVNRMWTRKDRRVTWGVWSDAQHFTDFAALHRVIDWTLARPWTSGRVYQAASRLHLALQNITATQEAEIQTQLRVAEMCVVRTLVQLPSGWFVRLPMTETSV